MKICPCQMLSPTFSTTVHDLRGNAIPVKRQIAMFRGNSVKARLSIGLTAMKDGPMYRIEYS